MNVKMTKNQIATLAAIVIISLILLVSAIAIYGVSLIAERHEHFKHPLLAMILILLCDIIISHKLTKLHEKILNHFDI